MPANGMNLNTRRMENERRTEIAPSTVKVKIGVASYPVALADRAMRGPKSPNGWGTQMARQARARVVLR